MNITSRLSSRFSRKFLAKLFLVDLLNGPYFLLLDAAYCLLTAAGLPSAQVAWLFA